jgi:hypothetical protein
MRVRFNGVVVVGLFSACGGKSPDAPTATTKTPGTCIPTGAAVVPTVTSLTQATLTFCVDNPHCFTADLEAKTIAAASADASGGGRTKANVIFNPGSGSADGPTSASIGPSVHSKGLTACTNDKLTCHELPIDAASVSDKPIAVSDDATLVAIDTRNPNDVKKSPGRLETWDAVTGKKLASFEMRYGPDHLGMDDVPRRGKLAFLGHTVLAFTEPGCALPCSSATMYSVRGNDLGLLASDPTAASAEHFHDDLYVIHSYGPPGPLVVQDAATGKSMQLGTDTNWDAVVTPDRIVRVVGPSSDIGPAPRSARVEVWGQDLKLVTAIAVPTCAAVAAGSGRRP